MQPPDYSQYPVGAVLDALGTALAHRHEVVLQAPPGAGKTTLVPLYLLDSPWLAGRRIVILEPRRMAARAAATRMAELLGEAVGQTVGYSIRMESKTSAATRIEVVTEGILTRRLQSDPGLEDIGLVIFDEFHERSLDADLCLALCLQGRELFREGPPLKLLVMSATLDGEAVAGLLGDAPVVTSEGRLYPVTTVFQGPQKLRDAIAAPVAATVRRALSEQAGSVLVFLPGQREINAVGRELQGLPADVRVESLYGGLSLERQRAAIAPSAPGERKVVLSTNVAETSLTIEGITAVVDAGLVREPRFDPATGVTRLVTRRVSRASATQRQGRAGRLGPGHCYRLWSEEQDTQLVAHAVPEIEQADLAPLALQLFAWGVGDPAELQWLNPPPAAAWQQALAVLEQIGALIRPGEGRFQLTPHGVRLAQVPLHPRFAHMLLVGCDIQASETACLLAAVLAERNPFAGEHGADIGDTLAVLMGQRNCPPRAGAWYRQIWQQAQRYSRIAGEVHKPRKLTVLVMPDDVPGILLASAWPDRIARRRSGGGVEYLLANGRSGVLGETDPLAREAWLAVAELGGLAGGSSDRIYSAAALNPENLESVLSSLVIQEDVVDWNDREGRFVADRLRRIGAIELSRSPLAEVPADARREALLGVVRRRGLSLLPWDDSLQQWRARVQLLHQAHAAAEGNPWPDLSDRALLDSLEDWLAPWLDGVRRLEDFRQLDLRAMLQALLPWPLPLELERLAPERLGVPSGSSIKLDYSQSPPVLAVKLQEMFGCEATPTIADGRIALQVHLLSPAGRPLQVTQDLAGFWRGSYQEVRREMRGRYPKHPWPENPLEAVATRHTKRRMETG
ncbi:ATP-dependent helicase HrpB [Haliea sp. E17]|uniref:ATP-dependent helicase HrpB n=1 Tax=Haliea sp. E17 TaxID=3401576 RepID=UPI003AAE8745